MSHWRPAELLCFDMNDMLESYGETTLWPGIEFFLKRADIPTIYNS
jgi:hypothetical protein